ncbi:MAG: aminotransferase class I/II-fold pyridoxal phosphate-dependent enzyme [Sphingobacteriales bacterium]|nr:MAG: aminotransferase class I/II-fold pyridoxal phosphate-dependent enzyme [Sphingobacteriales bacterium]
MKNFNFTDETGNQSISFKLSHHGQIDSKEYSLLETLYDQQLHQLSFEQRIEILNSYITDAKTTNHYSFRRQVQSGCKTTTKIMESGTMEEKVMINLSSNDYLNLSQHQQVKDAVTLAVQHYGLGSGSSPMFTGTTNVHRQLEQKIAQFKGTEDAMLFSSGYGANFGTIRALLTNNDAAICDMYAHASLMDGCTNTNKFYFRHNDIDSLAQALQKASKYKNKLVIIDGVYSMDGDIAPLEQIIQTARNYGAWVMVDDAHATGVIGKNGRGTADHFGLTGKVDLISGTFSKALGAVGGFVAGSKALIAYLRIACRAYMFSTAPAVPVMAGVIEAFNILDQEPYRIRQLHQNINYCRTQLLSMGFNIGNSRTAILPLIIGNDYKVKEMTYRLEQAGILVNAVPYPAVPKKLTRVRLTLTAGLARYQLDYALQEIERIASDLQIINNTYLFTQQQNKIQQDQLAFA